MLWILLWADSSAHRITVPPGYTSQTSESYLHFGGTVSISQPDRILQALPEAKCPGSEKRWTAIHPLSHRCFRRRLLLQSHSVQASGRSDPQILSPDLSTTLRFAGGYRYPGTRTFPVCEWFCMVFEKSYACSGFRPDGRCDWYFIW